MVKKKNDGIGRFSPDVSDGSMVARIRLLLAVSALLTVFIESPGSGDGDNDALTWLIFFGYTFHTVTLFIQSQRDKPFATSKLIHWLDVCWYAMMLLYSNQGLFFMFFFFAILTASFRWGFEEGARVAVASTLLYLATAIVEQPADGAASFLLRATFLLALGYMIANWGQSELALRRRLALLRDVSRLSNPRFGVDHTVTSVLRKTQAFFRADSCILVTHADDLPSYAYRAVKRGDGEGIAHAEQADAQALAPLLSFARDRIVAYGPPALSLAVFSARWRIHDSTRNDWITASGEEGDGVAELLGAHTFIAAPVPLRRGEGRIYVVSRSGDFSRADALFLSHIAAQAFPMIENIELLDRIASEAASQERQKIANDLHDSVIQPYIGLKLGLHAARKKALDGTPVAQDLDRLNDMASQVINDLRQYAGRFSGGAVPGESAFLATLHRQTEQVRKFYGIDITVSIDGHFAVSDRLAAEVYQVISEGLSNIRKHTSARRGAIRLRCAEGWLNIQIENEGEKAQPAAFTPRSIASRAAALGGRAKVLQGHDGRTAVHIEIPV
jgi:signal transduction histidine kinase